MSSLILTCCLLLKVENNCQVIKEIVWFSWCWVGWGNHPQSVFYPQRWPSALTLCGEAARSTAVLLDGTESKTPFSHLKGGTPKHIFVTLVGGGDDGGGGLQTRRRPSQCSRLRLNLVNHQMFLIWGPWPCNICKCDTTLYFFKHTVGLPPAGKKQILFTKRRNVCHVCSNENMYLKQILS